MKNAPINLIISLLLMILIIGLIVFIQIKLSRKENKYLGLILPGLSFLFSLVTILGMISYMGLSSSSSGIVESVETKLDYLGVFFIFLVTNIPTMLLVIIYYAERNKIKVNKSIEKMKIKDL